MRVTTDNPSRDPEREARIRRLSQQLAAAEPDAPSRGRPGPGVYTDRPGESWERVADAAAAAGCTPSDVHRAVNQGRTLKGRVWARVGCPLPTPPARVAVRSDRGESWPTAEAAAPVLGISERMVRYYARRRARVAGRRIEPGPDFGTKGYPRALTPTRHQQETA